MTIEEALWRIVENQRASGMSSGEFYAALAKISGNTAILSAVLAGSGYIVGKPSPISSEKLTQPIAPAGV